MTNHESEQNRADKILMDAVSNPGYEYYLRPSNEPLYSQSKLDKNKLIVRVKHLFQLNDHFSVLSNDTLID